MSGPEAPPRIAATPAAHAAIRALQADRGPLMFVQSGGCCDGSLPICLLNEELAIGPGDVLLGHVDGCPFYIDSMLYEAWRRPCLLLDVELGVPEGFSFAAGEYGHFVTRTDAPERCETAAAIHS